MGEDLPRRTDGFLPIAEYGLIGDGHTAALVGRDGSVDWLCWPRFDAPSVLGRILGLEAGHFRVSVADAVEVTRAYRPDTTILVTTFRTPGGRAELVDLIPIEGGDPATGSRGELVRSLRCTEGQVRAGIEYVPRPEYGARVPAVDRQGDHLVASWPEGRLWLATGASLRVEGGRATGAVDLRAGDRVDLVLRWEDPPDDPRPDRVDERIAETERYWRTWTSDLTYEGPYRSAVERSALTLKLLDYAPTGAIVASPTTSLPEGIGGVRNWDYRFGWIRDVALSVYALRRIGFPGEAAAFMDWAFNAARCRPHELQILYTIDGNTECHERTLDHLEGYRGSSPVRTGNAAADQLQLDAFGELLDCFHQWRRAGAEVTPAVWQCIRAHATWLERSWRRPDYGIWEVRDEPRRFTYSVAMSQMAFDRAIRAAEEEGLRAPVKRWRRARDAALRDVVEGSWNEDLGAFAQTLGGNDLDAAVLALPLRRVVEASHPRMRSTVEAVRRGLDAGDGLLHRYRASDGLPGEEGAFLLCSFWLVDCLSLQGDRDGATDLYERLLGHANDLGLMAEQVDPSSGAFVGNFPQGFSHIGVISSAVHLARDEGLDGA